MAKISVPLMSLSASGSIAQFLTFSRRISGQQVRWQKKQNDVETSGRSEQRSKFLLASLASRFWQVGDAECGASICGTDMDVINNIAKPTRLTGYNLSIKQTIHDF